MNNALVVIPTYNEQANLRRTVEQIVDAVPDVSILVVDDNSPDGTGDLADFLSEQYDTVYVLHRSQKNGLGEAYKAGFAWGIEEGFKKFVEMDADGSHHPEYLPTLINLLDEADMSVGSRYIPGGSTPEWAWHRTKLSSVGNKVAKKLLKTEVHDISSGFRGYTLEALHRTHYDTAESKGYSFQVEMILRAEQAGLKIVETPIAFTDRVKGSSKMDYRVLSETAGRMLKWSVRTRFMKKAVNG
jgi:dolichol-phosphate mannosyltransferase